MIFLVTHTGVGRKTKVLSFNRLNPTRIHTEVCLVGGPWCKTNEMGLPMTGVGKRPVLGILNIT